jgi:hypothetical protein
MFNNIILHMMMSYMQGNMTLWSITDDEVRLLIFIGDLIVLVWKCNGGGVIWNVFFGLLLGLLMYPSGDAFTSLTYS